MILINLASHCIQIMDAGGVTTLSYQGVEDHFCRYLYQYVSDDQDPQIAVINGPGAFTTMRVGAVALSTLHHVHPHVRLAQISKISLFKQAMSAGLLPPQGYLYAGMNKIVWWYDLITDTYERISHEHIADHRTAHGSARVDQEVYTLFDQLPETVRSTMLVDCVSVGFDGSKIVVLYHGSHHAIDPKDCQKVEHISPLYLMDPVGI